MITLRQLRYLTSLARHRHFGRAAADCAVTQPALSMQVRELEREIGAELVERRPGEIALTDTGLDVASAPSKSSPPPAIWSISPATATCSAGGFARHHPDAGALYLAARAAAAAGEISAIAAGSARDADQAAARRTGPRRTRRRDAGAAGGGRRRRDACPVRRCVPAGGAGGRCAAGARPRRRRGRRSAPAHSAGGGPLPARPGAGVLRGRRGAMRRPASAPPRSPP